MTTADHGAVPATKARYSRVLLKLSGEALMGSQAYGIDPKVASAIAEGCATVHVGV